MHIGLIGGIGPAATVVYYQRLVAEMKRRNAPLNLTIEQADVDVLVGHMTTDARAAQARVYLTHLQRLAGAGCDCAAITSLGGHFCFEEVQAISPLPLISAMAPLDAHFEAQGIGTVGLLGTKVVMETRFYGHLKATHALVPEGRVDEIGALYLATAQAGHCTDTQRAQFFSAGQEMVDRGAHAIVLAGTDLGLAFDGQDPGFPVVDALDVHVTVLADLACGRASLP